MCVRSSVCRGRPTRSLNSLLIIETCCFGGKGSGGVCAGHDVFVRVSVSRGTCWPTRFLNSLLIIELCFLGGKGIRGNLYQNVCVRVSVCQGRPT